MTYVHEIGSSSSVAQRLDTRAPSLSGCMIVVASPSTAATARTSSYDQLKALVDDIHVPGGNFAHFAPTIQQERQRDGSLVTTNHHRLLKVFRVVTVRTKKAGRVTTELKIQPYQQEISERRSVRLKKAGEPISFATFSRLVALNTSRKASPLHLVVDAVNEHAVKEQLEHAQAALSARRRVTTKAPEAISAVSVVEARPAVRLQALESLALRPEVLGKRVAATAHSFTQITPAIEALYNHFHRPRLASIHPIYSFLARCVDTHKNGLTRLATYLPRFVQSTIKNSIAHCQRHLHHEEVLARFSRARAASYLTQFVTNLYHEVEEQFKNTLRTVRVQCDEKGSPISVTAAGAPARSLFPLVVFKQGTIEQSLSKAYMLLGSFQNRNGEEMVAFMSVGQREEIRFVRKAFLHNGDGYGVPFRIPSIETDVPMDSHLFKMRELAQVLPELSSLDRAVFNKYVGLERLEDQADGMARYSPAAHNSIHGVFVEYASVVKMHAAQRRKQGPFGVSGDQWGCIWEFPKESSEPALCTSALSLPPVSVRPVTMNAQNRTSGSTHLRRRSGRYVYRT